MQSRMKLTTGHLNRHGAQAVGTGPWIVNTFWIRFHDRIMPSRMRVSRALLTTVQLSVWKSDTSGIRSTEYRPVSLRAAREIWRARPMNTAIDALLKKDHRVRSDYVRTEGTLLASMLRGWGDDRHTERSLRNLAHESDSYA